MLLDRIEMQKNIAENDLPGFVDVQEAIPAASSTAKPQAEETVSQGTASEPLAQECLGEIDGNGNSRKTSKKDRRIRKGRKTSIKYMDRWHDRHESMIDICEYYHTIAENAETYPFAHRKT